MSVWIELHVFLEIHRQSLEDVSLTIDQTTIWLVVSRLVGLEIDAMKSQLALQLRDLRGGNRHWWCQHGHHSGGRRTERRIAVIADAAGDSDIAWLRAAGTQGSRALAARDHSSIGAVVVNQRTIIRAVRTGADGRTAARLYCGWIRGA